MCPTRTGCHWKCPEGCPPGERKAFELPHAQRGERRRLAVGDAYGRLRECPSALRKRAIDVRLRTQHEFWLWKPRQLVCVRDGALVYVQLHVRERQL